jgi:hypothetical protein
VTRRATAGVPLAIRRVFLASSSELSDERARFPELVQEINARPDLARNFSLRSVVWERDAFGIGTTIHDTIKTSTDFEGLDVVVLVVWNRLGAGTLREYEEARANWDVHRRPALLAFFRTPSPEADASDVADVTAFKRRLLDEGVVTSEYSSPEEFGQRLGEQLPRCIASRPASEGTPFQVLRRRFVAAAAVAVLGSAVAIFLCRTMSFPDTGVTVQTVYLVLAFPIVLALGSGLVTWYYHRLLEAVKDIWHSPQWTDAEAYEAFRSLVPRVSLPARLRSQFPAGWGAMSVTSGALLVVFVAPVVGQYQCIFEELLVWEYTVGRSRDDFEVDEKTMIATNRYVDRGRKPWPFTLQDPLVRRRHEMPSGRTIYVHARGKFALDEKLPQDRLFRRNLGPQVFLPWQPWIYVVLMMASSSAVVFTLVRLIRFSSEFRLVRQ